LPAACAIAPFESMGSPNAVANPAVVAAVSSLRRFTFNLVILISFFDRWLILHVLY
jgi:hypothetical protein